MSLPCMSNRTQTAACEHPEHHIPFILTVCTVTYILYVNNQQSIFTQFRWMENFMCFSCSGSHDMSYSRQCMFDECVGSACDAGVWICLQRICLCHRTLNNNVHYARIVRQRLSRIHAFCNSFGICQES